MFRNDTERRFLEGLTQRQLDRRRMMQGMLATGGAAALANWAVANAVAQTPVSDATPVPEPYTGDLAADQVMRLPHSEPTTMDPGISYGDSELAIFYNIFDGLVGIDQRTGEVVARCAESWTANEDFTQYTFTLRQGMTWSDGTPLNANDFVYSWQRVLDPDLISQYVSAMFPIKNGEAISNGEMDFTELGVTALDDYTLQVDMEGPTPYFLLLASTWTFFPVPKHVIDEAGDTWVEAENIVSNGPYTLTEWTHDQQMVLTRNDSYFGEAPTLTSATFRIFVDASTQAYVAFESDELDYAAPEGPDLDRITSDPPEGIQIITFPSSNTFFVVCDCTNPPTDNMQFRQALSMALSRQTLASQILRDQFLPAPTLLPPDIQGNNPDAALPEDLDAAKALFAETGIDPASVNIELTYLSGTARFKTVAEYLQSTWQDAFGITITLAPIEDNTYIDWRASRETQPFGLYTATWGSDFSDPTNWLNKNFTKAYNHYRNHWQNDEFDAIVEEAALNADPVSRAEQYGEAEKIIVQEAGVIPMYRGQAFRVAKPYVKDLWFQPLLSVVHLRNVKIAAS
jgi:oligopeptide transport system substrate-binding protein